MGATKLAIYLVGLVIVAVAAWVFLTQTSIGQQVPGSLALVLILLLVGIGIMAAAGSINDTRVTRRVTRDAAPGYAAPPAYPDPQPRDARYPPTYAEPPAPAETLVDERRFD